MADAPLSPNRSALVAVSAALAARRADRLRATLEDAKSAASPTEVEEVILQSYLFLGYPAALNGFAMWREIAGGAPAPSVDDLGEWQTRGAEVCSAVYGGQYPRLRDNIRALHPDMERWMIGEGYGKVLGRPSLGLVDRELCIAALLAVIDAPAQLYSHLRGALNVGASTEEVEQALAIAGDMSSPDVRASAGATWRAVRARVSPAE